MIRDEYENMKITLRSHGKDFTGEENWDASFDAVLDVFIGLSVTAGYSYRGILTTLMERGEELLRIYFPEELPEEVQVENED